MKIIFLRHGETAHNTAMVITSGIPGNFLTERGVEQVQLRAELLRPLAPVAVYTSSLNRAKQSADIVGETLDLPIIEDNGLRECGVGELEGASGDAAFERFNEALDRWYLRGDLDFPLGPGGESARDAIERAREAVARIAAAHCPDDTVIAVSHQTLLQLILTFLSDNLESSFGHRRWLTNGGTSLVEVIAGGSVCLEWDDRLVTELLTEMQV